MRRPAADAKPSVTRVSPTIVAPHLVSVAVPVDVTPGFLAELGSGALLANYQRRHRRCGAAEYFPRRRWRSGATITPRRVDVGL